jgi:hypothetical protein
MKVSIEVKIFHYRITQFIRADQQHYLIGGYGAEDIHLIYFDITHTHIQQHIFIDIEARFRFECDQISQYKIIRNPEGEHTSDK